MTPPLTVLIAAPDVLPALKARVESSGGGELVAFADAEALKALEVITKRRPAIVALERLFAATPRGAALINRIKADPALSGSEIRVVTRDGERVRVSPRPGSDHDVSAAPAEPAAQAAPPLDHVGTRRAARFQIAPSVDVMVDGNQATLVDLSTVGAQIISGTVLKPNQRIRIVLVEGQGGVKLNGSVAWAFFEIPPKKGPQYRAGIAFLDPDAAAVDAYCLRHKAS